MLFLCLIVSLDDCIAHCPWQSNHLSVCTLRFMQIHLPACCWRVHSLGQKHSKRVLFLCLIVSLDDCIAHCPWQSNHLSVCTLRFMQIHLPACCWRVHSLGQKHSKRVLFLCLIVSLDDCIAHCPWYATGWRTGRTSTAVKTVMKNRT